MDRKELYAKVKSMNLAEEIKKKFGDNYTRVSNSCLEEFIASKAKKVAKNTSKKKEFDIKGAFVKLVSTLQANCVIDKADAEFILTA